MLIDLGDYLDRIRWVFLEQFLLKTRVKKLIHPFYNGEYVQRAFRMIQPITLVDGHQWKAFLPGDSQTE